MKQLLLGWSLVFLCNVAQAQVVDTFEIKFNLNDPKLTNKSEEYIDQLLYKNKIHRGQRLIILGYADYLGSEEDNMTLSEKRATHVKEYLITSGFRNEDVQVCVGKGEIANSAIDKAGKPDDRKVQIIIDKSKKRNVATAKTPAPLFDIATTKAGDVIPMDHVLFDMGSYTIADSSYRELTKLKYFLKKNPSIQIRIEGHVCGCHSIGNEKRDVDTGANSMSGHRAKSVYEFLVDNGINPSRMKYVGLGELSPFVNPERTQADEAKNRRVAIRILKK
jgi:outer membrane protein OmpA-like peptidoglycan-associated protein